MLIAPMTSPTMITTGSPSSSPLEPPVAAMPMPIEPSASVIVPRLGGERRFVASCSARSLVDPRVDRRADPVEERLDDFTLGVGAELATRADGRAQILALDLRTRHGCPLRPRVG